jgi:hypothetical protein
LQQKSYRQNKCAKLEFVLFYTSNFQKHLANIFLWVHFFPNISADLKTALNSAYICQKNTIAPGQMPVRHALHNLQRCGAFFAAFTSEKRWMTIKNVYSAIGN